MSILSKRKLNIHISLCILSLLFSQIYCDLSLNNNYNYHQSKKNGGDQSSLGVTTNRKEQQNGPQSTNKQSLAQTNHQDQTHAVDDILNDTISLLDELDRKLVAVDNRTPTAMMKDNLRALDMSNNEELLNQTKTARNLNGSKPINSDTNNTSEDASLEEALVRLADGFNMGRKQSEDLSSTSHDILLPSATNLMKQQEQSTEPSISREQSSSSGSSENFNLDFSLLDSNTPVTLRKKTRQLMHQHHQAHHSASFLDDNQLASDSTERHIKFTLDMMHAIFASQGYLAKTNTIESFLISPLSIQMVLMMMHLGARGQTKREISNCLHLNTNSANSLQLEKALGTIPSGIHKHQNQQQNQAQESGSNEQGSKLKRRHHQTGYNLENNSNKVVREQSSVGNARRESAAFPNLQNTPNNSRQQQQQQQQQISASNNAHELFGAAMRNLLKDPIVMKALTSANQIFVQKNLPLSAQYEWAIKHYYAADVKLVDFQHQSSSLSSASSSSSSAATTPGSGGAIEKGKGNDAQSTSAAATSTVSNLSNSTNSTNTSNHQANNVQQMIDEWVERQTKGRISNFLSSPISTSTLMMAINVLYFKGDWQYKFDPADTEIDSLFTQANGKTVKMPMLVNKLPVAFAHDPAMKTSVIELPYKAQRLGLFLLLPDEISGIYHTMEMLNSTSFANLISSMRKPSPGMDQSSSGINVRIPKFSIESTPKLSQILSQHLGLKSLFMPDSADLSGIFTPAQSYKKVMMNSNNNSSLQLNNNSPDSSQQTPLQVGLDELLHKAVLQVDEQGSVAAASSATIVERVGLFNSNYFEADHPFLLFLMDKQTGLVLFSGVFAGNNNNINGQKANATNNKHETQQLRQQQQH